MIFNFLFIIFALHQKHNSFTYAISSSPDDTLEVNQLHTSHSHTNKPHDYNYDNNFYFNTQHTGDDDYFTPPHYLANEANVHEFINTDTDESFSSSPLHSSIFSQLHSHLNDAHTYLTNIDISSSHISKKLFSALNTSKNFSTNPFTVTEKSSASPSSPQYLHLKRSVKCSKGYTSHAKNLHQLYGDMKIYLDDKSNVEKFELLNSANNSQKFLCNTEIHPIVVELIRNELLDENSFIYNELSRRNYIPNATSIHFSNASHAEVSFYCVEGFATKRQFEKHLRIHVHISNDQKLKLSPQMRSCECTPKSCANEILSYLDSIEATLLNQETRVELEDHFCSKEKGSSALEGYGEIEDDDFRCLNSLMHIEGDMRIQNCRIIQRPKCVYSHEFHMDLLSVPKKEWFVIITTAFCALGLCLGVQCC